MVFLEKLGKYMLKIHQSLNFIHFFCINRQRYMAKSGIILQIFLMRESHVRNK